jgi:hypothetical protein
VNHVARFTVMPLAVLLISATSAEQVIPLPDQDAGGEALVVPADSPVHFRGWNKYHYAQFDGRFVLTGTFMYGCEADCEGGGPYKTSDLELTVVPDPGLKARLPNWKIRHNDMMILISRSRSLQASLGSSVERRRLLAGKLPYIAGRISIVVDHFETGIECDSANFGARFVAVAKPARMARSDFNGDYGCGMI